MNLYILSFLSPLFLILTSVRFTLNITTVRFESQVDYALLIIISSLPYSIADSVSFLTIHPTYRLPSFVFFAFNYESLRLSQHGWPCGPLSGRLSMMRVFFASP
jgi:hypothetical protein